MFENVYDEIYEKFDIIFKKIRKENEMCKDKSEPLLINEYIEWRDVQLPGTNDKEFFVNRYNLSFGPNDMVMDLIRQLFDFQKRIEKLEENQDAD